MKKIIFALSAVALMVGCANEPVETPIELEKTTTVTVEVTPEQQTRTYTEGNKIYWNTTGEQLNIIYFADESTTRRQSATHADYTLVDNKATFTADLEPTAGAATYTLGAFYPYAYKSTTSSISLTVPQEQTPSATSYDPKADILVSKNPVVTNGLPDKLTFEFARLVAFAKMTIKGIPAGEKIEKVVFSSSAKPAGAVEFKVHEQGTLDNAEWYNNYEDITLKLGGREATGEDTVWFVTVPTDLSGTNFTVEVTTDKNIYTKTVDLSDKTLNFERADIAQFSVSGLTVVEKPKAYRLLTDAKELTVGDTFVICTKNAASSTAKLLSTVADGSALKFTSSMTVTDALEIVEVPADAAVMTVEAGVEAGTIACKAAEGYLYGNYDSENMSSKLYFKDTKDEDGSWKLTLSSSSYAATLYNETHGRYLNNYYGTKFNFAGSQGTYYYYIYYIDGEGSGETPDVPEVTPLATPVVIATASGNTITATWAAIDGAKDYTVTCGSQSQIVATTTATFEGLEYETEYTISVVANPADEAVNSVSEAGTTKVTTEADPNASTEAQTITLSFPENFPAGVASSNTVGTIYSGDVLISSTGTWRTDKVDGRDCIYIGRTTSGDLRIEAQNGKTITKVTLGAPVGYLVDLDAKEYDGYTTTTFENVTTAEWTGECKSRIVFTAAGNSHSNIATITVEYK